MEKYRLVQEHKLDHDQQEFDPHQTDAGMTENGFPEVRITQHGKPRSYISYTMNLFVSCPCVEEPRLTYSD